MSFRGVSSSDPILKNPAEQWLIATDFSSPRGAVPQRRPWCNHPASRKKPEVVEKPRHARLFSDLEVSSVFSLYFRALSCSDITWLGRLTEAFHAYKFAAIKFRHGFKSDQLQFTCFVARLLNRVARPRAAFSCPLQPLHRGEGMSISLDIKMDEWLTRSAGAALFACSYTTFGVIAEQAGIRKLYVPGRKPRYSRADVERVLRESLGEAKQRPTKG
jgi:hypothetical protein